MTTPRPRHRLGPEPAPVAPAHQRCRDDAGAAIVEMALMLPLVVAIALVIVTSGIAIEQRLNLDHAARESGRYGATLASSQTFANGGTWAANVRDVALARSAGDLGGDGAEVCVSLVEGSGSGGVQVVSGPFPRANYTTEADGTACDPAETYPTTLYDVGRRVQVRLARPSYIETGLGRWTLELRAEATVKSESAG